MSNAEFYSGNTYLNKEQMKTNAVYIRNYLINAGWSINAICGMLGNMETESTINPGLWESLDPSDTSRGYGLVQWTPSTKYTSWCSEHNLDPAHMNSALMRIEYELANGLQWIATNLYPMSFSEFKVSTKSPAYLADVFLKNYERPRVQEQPARATQAEAWYNYLTGSNSVDTNPKKKALSLMMMYMATKR